jgi:DNA helicase II / ATP-dependent DNA helicase PcrA
MDPSSLTSDQMQAVRHRGGPLLVLAGPGTGKTRTLTYRLAFLMAEGVARPDQILAITFTNKAAEEMRSRTESLVSEMGLLSLPRITTFHGFCFRYLREQNGAPLQLLSEQEALALLRKTIQEKQSSFPAQHVITLARLISRAKNAFQTPDGSGGLPDWEAYPDWGNYYKAYQEKLDGQHCLDFDEMLLRVVTLLEKDPLLREGLRNRFPYLFVDEFQDINPVQYRLFQLLTREEGDWMAIGDPNQAIYGFRGASADFFSLIARHCPTLTEIILEETFRLPQTFLKASRQVLAASPASRLFPMVSARSAALQIPVATLSSAEEEGDYITRLIEEEMGGFNFDSQSTGSLLNPASAGLRGFADFAVLYRLHAQGEQLAQAFLKKGIPFKKIREIPWWEQPKIRTCLRLLRELPDKSLSPAEALNRVLAQGNSDLQSAAVEEAEALKRLMLSAATFIGNLEEFIETLAIQTGLDTFEPDQETVKLLTLHAAKGLEFPVVFIAGCEENLLPLSLLKESDPEEERRLFYVGLTRAREKLFLTWSKRRTLFGQKLLQTPSPFIRDIESSLKTQITLESNHPSPKPRKKQLSLF